MKVLFPNQLFEQALEEQKVILVEDKRYFTEFNFHKQKLVLHRASMKAFEDRLKQNGVQTEYIRFDEELGTAFEAEEGLEFYDPVDRQLRGRIKSLASQENVEISFEETPMFLTSMSWNKKYFDENSYFQLLYYKQQRRRLDILMNDGEPVGGKWSFDPENRRKMPEEEELPEIPEFNSEYVEEAKEYVEQHFSENPGSMDGFSWPVTHRQATENLEDFLENRLEKFGDCQDAIDRDLKFGYHSLLSPSINTGLITPQEVVEKTLRYHEEKNYSMNSLEGFLRQIIGWREYIRAVYELEAEEMRQRNFFNAENKMPEAFYTAETGLPPVDDSINNVLENSYGHHIERLMVLGNVMLLLEIDPDEVYRWFVELFIDSYDWVMVPNVYGMSQYADDRIMTKPYISSSNYIHKMSHYPEGDWDSDWTGLYWSFIDKHREKLSDIQRMSFMVSTLDRMDEATLEEHRENAEKLRENIFGQ
ncbi:cryptochrome/photolyase family protein [Candidatus Nanohalococcus occultus]|uniref:Cryptochrome/photolyase family protein n=1 Tax=Candidatus Nanohalococcus occultus TaxID=2978047 RepID=A0ABY8CD29_9ARCH|nr:Uncharacterized protein SVXNc_0094 [Candidatus Nanohaloarchaeota archaeon SVXNc]